MNRLSKKIVMVIFLLLLFVVGIGTAYNSRESIDEIKAGDSFTEIKDGLESSILNNFLRRTDWVNINGLFHRMAQETIVRDPDYDVYKLTNGQIMYNLAPKDMHEYADYVVELRDALESMDIDLMYIQIPFKIKDDSFMPPGTHANGNENADKLVPLLRERGINTFDLREEIEKHNLDWSSLFFKTDHHWLPQTAFWAADLIMEKIHDDYGYEINESYYDVDNYELTTYENWMLGTVGRRTGVLYDGLDDFTLFNPKFDTEFSFYAKFKHDKEPPEIREGDFWNSMYYWPYLENRADFECNTYSTYYGRDYSHAKIVNKKSHNGLKILMIRDSFSSALTPFICLNADEVMAIDLRRYNEKSVPELCEEFQPNVVMIDYNPSAFHKEQFDFFDRGW